MKRLTSRIFVTTALMTVGSILLTGCQEKTAADINPDAQRYKLIADENLQLQRQIQSQRAQHAKQIEELKWQHKREMETQKRLLEQCQRQNKTLIEMSREGIDNYMMQFLRPLAEENKRLQDEINILRAQLDELKKGAADSK